MPASSRPLRRLLVLPPIVIGIAVLAWLAGGKQPPLRQEAQNPARSVRVLPVEPMTLVPVAEGYGSVQPARVWSAVAEVRGRIVEIHPELRDGAILATGTLLLRVDPSSYKLALAQAEAQLAELDVQETNTRASLAIEQRNLQLAERELKRIRDLVAQNSLSQNDADSAERSLLSARNAVQNLSNSLNLIPVQRSAQQTQLDQARRDLAHTELRAPFDIRVANLAVEIDQYVGVGQTLFQGDSVDRIEVVAQFSMPSIRHLIPRAGPAPFDALEMNANLAELTGFKPRLRLDLGDYTAEWEARFVRLSDAIDAQTRTVGVVVAVDEPFKQAIPGLRPPLSKGMFVQVLLQGRAQPGRLLVPRSAVHNGSLLLADADDRLRRQAVKIGMETAGLAVIETGLQAGDRVVLSDLVPAVEGMRLSPEVDEQTLQRLRDAAEPGA